MKTIIASAYFASDNVIYAVREYSPENPGKLFPPRVDRVAASKKIPNDKKMDCDLEKAVSGINALRGDAGLRAVVLICPGPFRTIDKDNELYGFIGRNADVPHWREKNAIAMFRAHLRSAIGDDANQVEIFLYNQGGATATGEYLSMYQSQLRAAREAGTLGREYKSIGNHLFIVADWSIQAGLIVDGEPFHGLSTINIGHHAILPAREDASFASSLHAACASHPNRPCLNSLASLDAIEKRWGMNAEAFQQTTDAQKLSLVAFYIAQMLADVVLTATPAKIVVGGRITGNPMFLDILKRQVRMLLRDGENPEIYPGYPEIQEMDQFILLQRDRDSGVKGGLHITSRLLAKAGDDNVRNFEAYKKGLYPL